MKILARIFCVSLCGANLAAFGVAWCDLISVSCLVLCLCQLLLCELVFPRNNKATMRRA